ncbi:heme-degrading domain-containing protein [Paenibacillus sp. CGMCC 1.16610]|uniref:Heme-degrading domain-containing protein n=1 Tax=Paenibacillus anseongense TaxID=2682845 RepID=A0ABW9U8I0_9BACL|nr:MULTISPECIES: heme-degrading domain-containing protein [Paenibacillus]MBA2937379.1 heme-degrading domain-containing protein [Paenibacillus sp. CGMCC 1.16610]MVQ36437.1 heme-degrading domain-containing protein [Paenibacillus anseongense]
MDVLPLDKYDDLLKTLLQEETDLQFSVFTNETAYRVGNRIIEKAMKENKAIVVNIRKNNELLFYSRMVGTSSNNDEWVTWKNNVVNHFGHSSYYMHVLLKSTASTVEASGLNPIDYKAEGGAFPLTLKDEGIVGTISVSGLPGEEDHNMITSVLKELLLGK